VQVLVAEDDRDIGALIVRYLRKNSWSSPSRVVRHRRACLRARESVDLVVLDLMLPGMGGLDVCRALRADPKTAAVPIIMVTAKVDERDRIAGLELGADDYVSKPFSPNELMAAGQGAGAAHQPWRRRTEVPAVRRAPHGPFHAHR
jgi:DNA-binding response OmpR family regulator